MKILLAIALGGAFGFVLQRAGASNPVNIVSMLSLRDFHIAKVILGALALSSVAIFTLQAINPEWVNLSIKSAHLGVVAGGLIFGLGFAIAGYCPGTSLCALGEGRRDALVFIIGGLAGAGAFTAVYGLIDGTWLLQKIGTGKITLANTDLGSIAALVDTLPAVVVALLFAVLFAVIAIVLPGRQKGSAA